MNTKMRNWRTNRQSGKKFKMSGKYRTLGESGGQAERQKLIRELAHISNGALPVMLSEWTIDELYHEVEYRHKLHRDDPLHRHRPHNREHKRILHP